MITALSQDNVLPRIRIIRSAMVSSCRRLIHTPTVEAVSHLRQLPPTKKTGLPQSTRRSPHYHQVLHCGRSLSTQVKSARATKKITLPQSTRASPCYHQVMTCRRRLLTQVMKARAISLAKVRVRSSIRILVIQGSLPSQFLSPLSVV